MTTAQDLRENLEALIKEAEVLCREAKNATSTEARAANAFADEVDDADAFADEVDALIGQYNDAKNNGQLNESKIDELSKKAEKLREKAEELRDPTTTVTDKLAAKTAMQTPATPTPPKESPLSFRKKKGRNAFVGWFKNTFAEVDFGIFVQTFVLVLLLVLVVGMLIHFFNPATPGFLLLLMLGTFSGAFIGALQSRPYTRPATEERQV